MIAVGVLSTIAGLWYHRNVLHFERVKPVHYVPSSVTPQNAVLVASNHSSSLARRKSHI